MNELNQTLAQIKLGSAIESAAARLGITEDAVNAEIEALMMPYVKIAQTMQTEAQVIELYRTQLPEQFEALKNNPALLEVAKGHIRPIAIANLNEMAKVVSKYLVDEVSTQEVLTAIGA
jgi:hypothetical protein